MTEDKENNELREINPEKLSPEMQFNLLLMLLAQGLPQADMGADFILLCKHPKLGWGAHSNLGTQAEVQAVLAKLAGATPKVVETRHLDMEDFVTDGKTKRVKQ